MKHINFIKTLSPKEHKSIQRWFNASALLGIITIITVATIHIKQRLTFLHVQSKQQTLRKKTALYEQTNTKKHKLLIAEKGLKNHVSILESYTHEPHLQAIYLSVLKNICIRKTKLESANIDGNSIELRASSTTLQEAKRCIGLLQNNEHFSHIKLITLQPYQDGITFILKGNLTT